MPELLKKINLLIDKMNSGYILSVNCGSSSLKFALFRFSHGLEMEWSGHIDRIGFPKSHFIILNREGLILADDKTGHSNIEEAVNRLARWLKLNANKYQLEAIGYRIIHGGLANREHKMASKELIKSLKLLIPLAPNHLPDELKTMNILFEAFPNVPQVACFDTVFHKDMPFYARRFSLPFELSKEGVIRYGFHGLSYEYVLRKLRRLAPKEAKGKVVIAHLGNGASMAAVRNGKSIDTTMGLTPTGGLIMGTRCGDLDPGIALYLMKQKKVSPKKLEKLFNHQSGLKGISGVSSDMMVLLDMETTNLRAREAITMFCYQARKFVGSLSVSLEGINTLVFTGGIGENAATIRSRICKGLQFLGIEIDKNKNNRHREIISTKNSAVTIRVIKTNEEFMIAQHSYHKILSKRRNILI